MKTHFEVPARELLLDTPEPCPFHPPLTFDGVAVDDQDHQYLILSHPAARFYAGPDAATVHQTGELFTDALRAGATRLNPDIAAAAGWWIGECWDAVVDGIVDQLRPALAAL